MKNIFILIAILLITGAAVFYYFSKGHEQRYILPNGNRFIVSWNTQSKKIEFSSPKQNKTNFSFRKKTSSKQ